MSWQDVAAQVTLCNFGTTGATYAAAAAWGSAYTGQIWGTVGFGATSAALAAASAAAGCYTPPPEPPPSSSGICCSEWSDQTADVFWTTDPGAIGGSTGSDFPANVQYLASCRAGGTPPVGMPGSYIPILFSVAKADGVFYDHQSACPPEWLDEGCFSLGMTNSGQCAGTAPPPEPILPDPPTPIPTPDPETGCNWFTTMADAYLNESGNLVVLYKATSDDPEACGGPLYWWDEVGKPPTPVNPRPDPGPIPPPEPLPTPCPDPCIDYTDQLNRIESLLQGDDGDNLFKMLDRILLILDIVTNVLGTDDKADELLPGVNYSLQGVCENVPDGQDQPIKERAIPQAKGLYGVIARIDAISLFLQDHLEYKTPTCRDDSSTKEGDFRTISFISDEMSPEGKRRLSKRLRYRSVSGIGLADLVDHWRTFTWQAGPVCVSHKGAPWGAPQVWAATAEEGKRVIRHAALEAGLDPDQVGRWLIGGSDNPRYGMPGTMRVNTKGGYYWITERLDSNARPLVANT